MRPPARIGDFPFHFDNGQLKTVEIPLGRCVFSYIKSDTSHIQCVFVVHWKIHRRLQKGDFP